MIFFSVFWAWKFIFDNGLIKPLNERYSKKSEEDKAYWLSCWTANTHHLIIYTAVFFTYQNPVRCEGEPYPWKYFYDDLCFITPHKIYFQVSLITAGYLTADFYIQYFKVKGTDPISK